MTDLVLQDSPALPCALARGVGGGRLAQRRAPADPPAEDPAADPLPAVLPLVLYSGKRPWTAPTELLDLFRGVPRELRRRLPRRDYLLVDEGRLAPEELSQQDNLVAALFASKPRRPRSSRGGPSR